jgi:hypothetical protein
VGGEVIAERPHPLGDGLEVFNEPDEVDVWMWRVLQQRQPLFMSRRR